MHRIGKRCVRTAQEALRSVNGSVGSTQAKRDFRSNRCTQQCSVGELLTATAKKRGAIGAVLDGYSRDTPQVLSQNFPVFCSATWAQDSSVRTYVCDFRCTIEIGQVTIHDGDLIFGDIDGVLVIPKEIMHEVLEKALIKASGEKKVRNAIENGMSATEAFATFGIL